jgi:hypothetical protein
MAGLSAQNLANECIGLSPLSHVQRTAGDPGGSFYALSNVQWNPNEFSA